MITSKEFQALGVERGIIMKLEDAEKVMIEVLRRSVKSKCKPTTEIKPAIGLEQFQSWDIGRLVRGKK